MAATSPPGHGTGSSVTDGEQEEGPPKKVQKTGGEEPEEGDNRRPIRGSTSAPRRQAPRRTPINAEDAGGAQGQGPVPDPQRKRPYSVVQIARASNAPPFYAVFRCEVCGKGCKTAAGLGSHKRVHDRDGN